MSDKFEGLVPLYEWDFANGMDIWAANGVTTVTQHEGYINASASSYLGTIVTVHTKPLNAKGWDGHYVIARVRRTDSAVGQSRYGMLYTTKSQTSFDATKRVDLTRNDSPLGEWVNLVYNMSENPYQGDLSQWNNSTITRLLFDIGGAGDAYDIKSIGIYRPKTPYEGFVPDVTWDFTNDLQGWSHHSGTKIEHDALGFMKTKVIVQNTAKYVSSARRVTESYPLLRIVASSPTESILNGRVILRRFSDGQNTTVNYPPVTIGDGYQEVFIELPEIPGGTRQLFVDVGDNVGDEFHIKSIEYGHVFVPVSEVKLTPKALNISVGQKWQIDAEVRPLSADDKSLSWSSSSQSVSVVDGLVTGLSLGSATITAAAANGITAQCEVSVVEVTAPSVGSAQQGGMRVRRLDKNGDWTFGSGRSNYATGSEAIYQCVLTALLSFRGDWFLDLDHGIPWFDYLRKNPDLLNMENSVKSAVLGVIGVEKITAFDINLNRDTRVATVSINYVDSFGVENGVISDVNNN